MQPFRGNPPGLGRQMIDGRERSPRQDVAANPGQHDDYRKPEHEHDQHFPQLGSQLGFRARHPQHNRPSANQGGASEHPPRMTVRHDGFVPRLRGGRRERHRRQRRGRAGSVDLIAAR